MSWILITKVVSPILSQVLQKKMLVSPTRFQEIVWPRFVGVFVYLHFSAFFLGFGIVGFIVICLFAFYINFVSELV